MSLARGYGVKVRARLVEMLHQEPSLSSELLTAIKQRMLDEQEDRCIRGSAALCLASEGEPSGYAYLEDVAMNATLLEDVRLEALKGFYSSNTKIEEFCEILFTLVFSRKEDMGFLKKLMDGFYQLESLSPKQEQIVVDAIYNADNPLWMRVGLLQWVQPDRRLYALVSNPNQPEELRYEVLCRFYAENEALELDLVWEIIASKNNPDKLRAEALDGLELSVGGKSYAKGRAILEGLLDMVEDKSESDAIFLAAGSAAACLSHA